MSKVTMYRGIDAFDGKDSLFAACDGVVAATYYRDDSVWLSPDTFGDFTDWCSGASDIGSERYKKLHEMNVVWER